MVLMNLFADRDSGGENRLMGTLEAGAEGSEWRAGTRLHGPRVSGDLPRASGPGTGTLHQPKWPGKSGRWGEVAGRFNREGTCEHLLPIHVDTW